MIVLGEERRGDLPRLCVEMLCGLSSAGAETGLLHLLARGVRSRVNTLDFEFEVVGVARVFQRRFVAHQTLLIEVVERLVKRLLSVLRRSSPDPFMDKPRFFRRHDAL